MHRNKYLTLTRELLQKYPDIRFQDCFVEGNDVAKGTLSRGLIGNELGVEWLLAFDGVIDRKAGWWGCVHEWLHVRLCVRVL